MPSLADVLLLGAILCVMSYGIGSYGLYEPHEGHFAGVGREMVTRGDWITPHLNGAPYLNKPPLFIGSLPPATRLPDRRTNGARESRWL